MGTTLAAAPAEDITQDLRDRFAQPPSASRILKIIHSWPDEAEAQDALICRLVNQGFGGVVCNVSFQDYLESDARWEAFVRAVKAARQAGLTLWLYDEKGYPSANAGGLVLREHPEWQARGLLVADAESRGGPVELEPPPGELFLAAAFPAVDGEVQLSQKVNLTDRVADGKLAWDAPAGDWRVMAVTDSPLFAGTHAELNLAAKMPYPNLLMPEPTARFIEVTHERYAAHLGQDLGQWFVATFTDEPSLMSMFLRRMPYRVLPWAPGLAAEFRKRRGYALEPLLPALLADAGPQGRKTRYDFWLTVGELVSGHFFGQIQEWCAEHNLLSGGHLLAEEDLLPHVPLYGDFFRCIRRLDAPSIDCLTSLPPQVPWHIARLARSAAELEGKAVVMCETSDHAQRYRPAGDQRPVRTVSESEIRGTCNRLLVSGVNVITSYYSFADLSDEQLRRLNEWVGRCAAMLTGGHQAADIAVVYPTESIWPRFTPAQVWANDSPEAMQIQSTYRWVSETLFAAQCDFTYVDGRALVEAKPDHGELVHGHLRWSVVILPMADTLPLAAWGNLAVFVRSGGVVIAIGTLPANSESQFPSDRVQALAKEVFGEVSDGPEVLANVAGGVGVFLPEGTEALLPSVLDRLLEPDVKAVGKELPLRATHRRIQDHDVYFLINDGDQPWEGEVGLRVAGQGEKWDPDSGTIATLPATGRVRLSLSPYGATFLRFPHARPPARERRDHGALPRLATRELPAREPRLLGGEFVKGELASDADHSTSGRRVWRAAATLTKGQVDTWLFTCFQHDTGFDLSQAHALVFESWVPQGQRTPNQLLVILQERDGSDYFASADRSLAAPSHRRSFVPLSRFQLAGWSQDQNGKLDADHIGEIRIGWGGYFGANGERIEFSVAVPQVLQAAR